MRVADQKVSRLLSVSPNVDHHCRLRTMQALQPLGLRSLRSAAPAGILARASPVVFPPVSSSLLQHRSYSSPANDTAELQKKQLRMAEKAGRMKQNMGAVSPPLSLSLARAP